MWENSFSTAIILFLGHNVSNQQMGEINVFLNILPPWQYIVNGDLSLLQEHHNT